MPISVHPLPKRTNSVLPILNLSHLSFHSNPLLKADNCFLPGYFLLLPLQHLNLPNLPYFFTYSDVRGRLFVWVSCVSPTPSAHSRVSCPCPCYFLLFHLFHPHVVTCVLPFTSQTSMNTTHRRAIPFIKPQNLTRFKLGKPHTHHLDCWVKNK